MPETKVILENRAPETQQVLRQIKGWGINWGITIVAFLFVGLLVLAFQVTFNQTERVPLQVQSAWVVEAESPDMVAETDELRLTIGEEVYLLTKEVGASTRFRADRPLPVKKNFPYAASARYEKEVHILGIIFKGIL